MKETFFSLRSHPRLVLISGLLLTTILAFIVYKSLSPDIPLTANGQQAIKHNIPLTANDQQAIKHVTLIEFGSVDELVVIPHADPNLSIKLAAADIAAARAHATAVFNSIYAPECVICKNIVKSIDQAIVGQTNGQYRALDGGARNVEWRQISPSTNGTVTATLAGTLWSRVAATGNTYTPTSAVVTVYTLKKFGPHWLIINRVDQSNGA